MNEKQTIYCNRFVSDILGYTPDEIKSPDTNPLDEYIHPSDREAVRQHLVRCSSLTPGNYLEIEYQIKDSRGNWHWFNARDTFY
ncbi:PAS domain-containing protein [Chroococcus sp. FPU101]|uniref:PAS domain-containing protein n=1 Tax=Chroococcus sp. FPU101 TaxID=1974212 RepID=UPI001AA4E095|nr:PAS domain-containing protein [Chroococcus sp. FPU101]GFE67496.1 hypothetical protein CFPU101_01060 [Chroococcus sp. FPU101]